MSRSLTIGLALVLLLAGSTLLWWTLGHAETAPPPRQPIEGLTDTVSIGWTTKETATINATHASDALTALGYVHGTMRPWTVTVWRRTALGTLSTWFGKELVPLDRHARRLGFPRHAREAYEELPSSTQQRLRAYVCGLNAALLSEPVRHRDPFVFFDRAPQRWRPWHPLAIERLLAWMGTDLLTSPGDSFSSNSDFHAADRLLRWWLHLHGWNRSTAWAVRPTTDTARTALFARHALGASAAPLLLELTLRRPGAPPLVAATLPGAPLFPTGTTGSRAWTYLLGSPTRLDSVHMDTSQIRDWHERITPMNGDEQLVHVRRYDTGLMLPPSSSLPGSDSAWVVRWPGFQDWSDVPAWLSQAHLEAASAPSESSPPSFRLMDGAGLIVDSTGDWTVQGPPPVVERSPNAVLVGRSSWARHQAEALRAHQPAPSVDPAGWSASDSSTWAAALLPRLLPDLAPLSGEGPILDDALPYLRNWNYVYESPSIGAVLFEQWMRAYRNEIGRVPTIPDTTPLATPRRRETFRRAVDTLAAQYGRDVRRWRWERVAPDRRYFPVWSADSLVSADLRGLRTTQFAPLDRPGRGHPSTLAGGATLMDPLPLGPAPTHWDGWMRSGRPTLTVRRLRFDPSAFFARSLLPDERPASISVSGADVTSTTHLVPARGRKENPPSE